MKINLCNSPFVFGADHCTVEENGISLNRMTPALENLYQYPPAAALRASCASGVRIIFRSNTRFLAMKLSFGKSAREIFKTDVVIDRNRRLSFGPESYEKDFSFSFELEDDSEKLFEIHLPHLAECRVAELEIEQGCSIDPVTFNRKILFIGDSITQGMTCSGPALSFAAITAAELDCDFQNIAVGGAVMDGAAAKAALELDWDTACVAFGVNDTGQCTPPQKFIEETENTLKYLCSRKDSAVNIITPIPTLPAGAKNKSGLTLEDYRGFIAATAAKFADVNLIDGTTLVPADENYFIDGLHPNDEGMSIYAENLLDIFEL